MGRESIFQVIKGVLAAFLLSAVILIILAFLMYRFDVAESVVRGGIIAAYVFSCFIGGMVISKGKKGRKYLWGILAGALYYAIILIISMIVNKRMFINIPGIVSTGVLCLLGGMLGGMLQAGKGLG